MSTSTLSSGTSELKAVRYVLRVLVWTWVALGLAPFVVNAMVRPAFGQLFVQAPWVELALRGVQGALAVGAIGTILTQWIWFRAPTLKKRVYPETKTSNRSDWLLPIAVWIAFVAVYAGYLWQSRLADVIARQLPGTTAIAKGTIIRYQLARPVHLVFNLDRDPGRTFSVVYRDGRLWDADRAPDYFSTWVPDFGERATFTIHESAIGRTLLSVRPGVDEKRP